MRFRKVTKKLEKTWYIFSNFVKKSGLVVVWIRFNKSLLFMNIQVNYDCTLHTGTVRKTNWIFFVKRKSGEVSLSMPLLFIKWVIFFFSKTGPSSSKKDNIGQKM